MELALNPFHLRSAIPAAAFTLILWYYLTSRIRSHVRTQTKGAHQTRAAIFTHERIPGFRSGYRPQAPWPRIHQCHQGPLQV